MTSPMPPDGLPLVTGAQAGEADRAAVAAGATWDGLLARAGGGLARVVLDLLRQRSGGVYGRRVLVAVGKGDNGGDGWVCADRLRARGVAVTVLAPHGVEVDTSAHTRRARAHWLGTGGRVETHAEAYADRWPRLARHDLPDVAVDCLLGTGATGAPRRAVAPAVRVLRGLRQARTGIVACDVPSGVEADTGRVADPDLAVVADRTVTFGAAKRGLVLDPGREHAGSVEVVDLGPSWSLPEDPFGGPGQVGAWFATGDALAAPRPWDSTDDKRARGRVLVVAGSARFGGAAALCGRAALRTGAGLVTVATSGPTAAVLADEPALMVRGLIAADDEVGGPAAGAVDAVLDALVDITAAVVGPGLGHAPATRDVVEAVIGASPDGPDQRVVVLDADGCNVFRHDVEGLARAVARGVRLVLTPHERELARLLDVEVPGTAAERVELARQVVDRTGAIVVAKGPATVVVGPDAPTFVGTSGGPALGTGGSGDVLAGMLGAVLARDRSRGSDTVQHVAGTVHLHGLVGEAAGARSAGRSTATDLLDVLPGVLAGLATRRETGRWRWSGT